MSHLQGMIFHHYSSFTLRFPISCWTDLVQWTSFLIKALRTRNSLDWLWSTLTIQLNLHFGIMNVCAFLLVVTSLIEWKWSECSSYISVVLCQSSSISEAPWGLVQAKPCSSSERRTIVVYYANSRINLLVRKAGRLISFNNGLPHLMHDIYSGWVQMA